MPKRRKSPEEKIRCPECGKEAAIPQEGLSAALEIFEKSGLGKVREFGPSHERLLDLFIKAWLDALRGQCFVIHYYGGSLLDAMEGMLAPVAPGDPFRRAVLARVREDIRLRDEFKAKGSGYVRAGHALRMRGLLG